MAKKSKKSNFNSKSSVSQSRRARQKAGLTNAQLKQEGYSRADRKEISRLISQEKRSQRPQLLPQKATDDEIISYLISMEEVISSVNARIDSLQSQGLTTVELARFQEGDSTKRFSLPDSLDPNEVRAYMTEVRVVASSIHEDSKKALLDTALVEAEIYKGQFGSQYPVTHYNIKDVFDDNGNIIRKGINPDIASKAFEAYRNLESDYGPIIGRAGQKGVFGSENLIIAIYDIIERGMDGQLYGRDLLLAWQDEFNKEVEGANFLLNNASEIIGNWDDFFAKRYF